MVYSLDNLDTLLSLYRTAFLIRHVELEIAREYPKGEMRCPVHLSVGQEITSAVFSMFQKNIDYAVSSHRAHAHYLAKGGNLNAMIAEIFGKVTGCSKGRGGSMHLSDSSVRFMGSSAIVGNSIPVGVGIAYGIKLRKDEAKSYIFFGEGASEEGVFYESLNFAIIHNLPAIFICENNLYSVYTDLLSRQPRGRSVHEVVSALGMPSIKVPFGKLDELMNAFNEFVNSPVNGPKFIEVDTYRWLEHCGPNSDDTLNYRPTVELENRLTYDVVMDLGEMIRSKANKLDNGIEELEEEIRSLIKEAFTFARSSPFPTIETALGDFHENRR